MQSRPFKDLFAIPLRNGLTKPKAVRGAGTKMVNMGELFANPRITNVVMDRVPLNQAEHNVSLLAEGDLLFARQSLVLSGAGKCSIFVSDVEEVCFESHVIRCRLNRDLADPDFYFYFFSSPTGRKLIESIVEQGAGASGIRGSDLAELEVPWVDTTMQTRVATVLRGLDDKWATNHRINQTLEAMAQAIFKSWFVDFDPVKAKIAAKAAGQDSLRAAMTAISGKPDAALDALPPEQYTQLAATAELFPDEREESEIGEIPKGWVPSPLSKLCDLNARSWNVKTLPDTVQYVDLANTKNGEIIEIQTVTGVDIPSRARRVLEIGDTVVGTVRPGNRSYAFVGEAGLTGSTGFAALHPKKEVFREYVYLAATSDENIERLAHLADGGAYPAVRPELVVADVIPVPNDDLLIAFHHASAGMFNKIVLNRKLNQCLADLRNLLLPKLLFGELLLSDPLVEAEA
jgi:type I restriction enzyme, S subunit